MKKRLLSMALTGALALTMCSSMTAFAADKTIDSADDLGEVTVEGDAELVTPTINVTVPGELAVAINPYQIKYAGSTVADSTDAQDQIISVAQEITSSSNVAMSVDITATATVSEGVKLATADIKDTDTTKSAFIYMKLKAGDKTTNEEALKAAYNKSEDIAFAAKATTKKGAVVLPAKDGDDGKISFKINGNASKTPSTPWSDSDTVKLSVVFAFNPTANTVE